MGLGYVFQQTTGRIEYIWDQCKRGLRNKCPARLIYFKSQIVILSCYAVYWPEANHVLLIYNQKKKKNLTKVSDAHTKYQIR